MKNIFFLILSAVFFSEGSATENEPKDNENAEEKTIPFIIEKRTLIPSKKRENFNPRAFLGSQKLGESGAIEITTEALRVTRLEITNLIETFKKDICPSNKGGSFEITLKVDSSMKILGIGFSGEGGLKATINCDK
jgi:hypothetical protein